MNFYFSDDLSAFLNPTYNKFTYDHNIMGMDTDSNQVLDSPEFLLKSGIIYKVVDFEIIPTASYMGSRYGDALNNEKIDSVWLANLLVRYEKKNFYKSSDLLLTLESNNIFNKEYISVINASDDSLKSSSYYQGAPRNIMFSMGMNF
mgnify:CR=1 FL=1